MKEGLVELWEKGFFERFRSNKEVSKRLLKEYGATTANMAAVLNNCKSFLRKGEKGWIQRVRYEGKKDGIKKNVDYFTLLNIHPRVEKASKKLFVDGHYPQAILEAFKSVNILVKKKAGKPNLDGKSLMLTTFSINEPILAINKMASTSDKDEQEGFMHLFAGAMQGIRNPKAHEIVVQKDQKVALQYLAFASLLCRMVEKAKKVKPLRR